MLLTLLLLLLLFNWTVEKSQWDCVFTDVELTPTDGLGMLKEATFFIPNPSFINILHFHAQNLNSITDKSSLSAYIKPLKQRDIFCRLF
jgi:hypothetical protein